MTDQTTETTETTETSAAEADAASAETSTEETSQETTENETTALGGAGETGEEEASGDETDEAGGNEDGQGAPEAYSLSFKNGDGEEVPLDAEMVEQAGEIFRELNLTNEQANQMVPLGVEMMNRGVQAGLTQLAEAGAAQSKEWLETSQAAEFIGGASFKEAMAASAIGLDAMGFVKGSDFRKLLDESGLGNHPDMIRTFQQLGRLAGEDRTFADPSGASETSQAGWPDRYNKTDTGKE